TGAARACISTALRQNPSRFSSALEAPAAAGDKAKQDAANKRWFANADEIAAFLSGANPKNWPAADAKSIVHDHLNLTTKEVVAHLGKDWKADVAAYDAVHAQILH